MAITFQYKHKRKRYTDYKKHARVCARTHTKKGSLGNVLSHLAGLNTDDSSHGSPRGHGVLLSMGASVQCLGFNHLLPPSMKTTRQC